MSESPLKSLDDEQVEGAAGGYLYYDEDETCFGDRWKVIDGKGGVVCSHAFWDDAIDCARERGLSDKEITLEELQRLRETGSIQ